MYNRAFPIGNALFFFAGEMSLFRLPRGKFSLPFLRDFYLDIQNTAEKRMQEITLKDVLEQYKARMKSINLEE